jgi:hypothetical protein
MLAAVALPGVLAQILDFEKTYVGMDAAQVFESGYPGWQRYDDFHGHSGHGAGLPLQGRHARPQMTRIGGSGSVTGNGDHDRKNGLFGFRQGLVYPTSEGE